MYDNFVCIIDNCMYDNFYHRLVIMLNKRRYFTAKFLNIYQNTCIFTCIYIIYTIVKPLQLSI